MYFQNDTLFNSLVVLPHVYHHGMKEAIHSHSVAQFIHINHGVIRVHTDEDCWVIPKNRGIWIEKGVEHSLSAIGHVELNTIFIDPLYRANLPSDTAIFHVSNLLKELMNSIVLLSNTDIKSIRYKRITELILDELTIMEAFDFRVPIPLNKELNELCQQILQRLDHPWAVIDVAKKLGISERTVSRKFVKNIGMSFSEWLRRQRLLKGMELLASGSSVLDTAVAVGYDSQSAFCIAFKSRVGVPPSEYMSK